MSCVRASFRGALNPILCLMLSLVVASVSYAQPLPGTVDITDFEHTRAWQLTIDGEALPGARVHYSNYEVAWLVEAPRVGMLLISPRGNSVQKVAEKGFGTKAGIRAELKADSTLEQVATYTVSRRVMRFELEGRVFTLEPAPPMLGRQSHGAVEERHPGFEHNAAKYQAKAATKSAPITEDREDVVVRVYFGSWSTYCERVVPKIIGVEKAWKHVRFEYYGLPERIIDDEQAVEHRISGVPTVLVLKDGEEVERLTGRVLDDPVSALDQALADL